MSIESQPHLNPSLQAEAKQASGILFNAGRIYDGTAEGFMLNLPELGTFRDASREALEKQGIQVEGDVIETPLSSIAADENDGLYVVRHTKDGIIEVETTFSRETGTVVKEVSIQKFKDGRPAKESNISGKAAQTIGARVIHRAVLDISDRIQAAQRHR